MKILNFSFETIKLLSGTLHKKMIRDKSKGSYLERSVPISFAQVVSIILVGN